MPDDYYVSQYSGEEIDALLGGAGAGTVRYDAAQTLTTAQKQQARTNIGAAPSGYGYGESITCYNFTQERSAILDQFDAILSEMGNDTAKQILIYDLSVSPGQVVCSASIVKSNADKASVSSNFDENGQAIVYRKQGGIWQPVEFVNPNLRLGVEYRTTERYLGKPVYCKVVDCGNLPAPGSLKNVSHGVSGCLPIMVTGQMSNTNTIPWKGKFTVSADNINIVLYSPADESDFSSLTATAILKYTKTTD